jgi:hypothetical protein
MPRRSQEASTDAVLAVPVEMMWRGGGTGEVGGMRA